MLPLSTTQAEQPKRASKCKESERGDSLAPELFRPREIICVEDVFPKSGRLRAIGKLKQRPVSKSRFPKGRDAPLDPRTKRRPFCEGDVSQKTHPSSRLFSSNSAPLLSTANARLFCEKSATSLDRRIEKYARQDFFRKARHASRRPH